MTANPILYLKTYTKDWYANLESTDFWVRHETAAWDIMRQHAVAGPDVFGFLTTCDNPIGRPFVITRRLAGVPLTDQLLDATKGDWANLLTIFGAYLRNCTRSRSNSPAICQRPTVRILRLIRIAGSAMH